MDRRTFDVLIKQTLRDRAEEASMPETRKNQIYQAIADCRKEEKRMKFSARKKLAVAAAVMCLCGTMVAMAAGKIAYYSSGHSVDDPEFASYEDLDRAEELAGFPVKAVERFDNGYEFSAGYLINVDASDENHQVVDTFPEVSIEYKKGDERITLDVEQVRPEWEESTTGNPVKIPYGDFTMTYREDHYKFVPPDYQLTEEDQKAMDSGELYLSYGSQEVEYTDFHFLEWTDGEIRYLLLCNGEAAPGQEELVKMGQQVIDSGK